MAGKLAVEKVAERVDATVLIKAVAKADEKAGPLVGEMAVMTDEKMVIVKGR